VTFDGAMPGGFSSYRAYRAPWSGRPVDTPLVTVGPDDAGAMQAWVSWNGATDVGEWELMAGDDEGSLRPAGRVPRDGFEAALPVPAGAAVVGGRALDRRGRRLARSAPVAVEVAPA
jgi:hypothetical protein